MVNNDPAGSADRENIESLRCAVQTSEGATAMRWVTSDDDNGTTAPACGHSRPRLQPRAPLRIALLGCGTVGSAVPG